MAKYYNDDKDRLSLVEQVAEKNPALIVGQPIDRNVAQLHNTGVTPATPEGFEGSSKSVYTHNDSQGSVKDKMNANSELWWEAKAAGDTDWMKSLEAANQQLAGLLGDGVTYNPSSGTWSGVADMPATMQASMTTGVNPQLPTYESAYSAKIDQLMNEMLNREKFSYNAESDPLFQQYKNIYTREGNRSMNDTLAAAASGAGGMSSYAMTAAQQANNYYMAQLGDKIPELQQLAYEMYMNDLGQQRQDISMLQSQDSYEYGKYRDQMSDYKWGTEFNYGASRDQIADKRYDTEWKHMLVRELVEDERYDDEWEHMLERELVEDERYDDEWRYKKIQDQNADERYAEEWEYKKGQDQTADERYARDEAYNRVLDILSAGGTPSSELLEAAGLSQEDAEAIPNGVNPYLSELLTSEQEAAANASRNDKGLMMVNPDTMAELEYYGAFVYNPDGSFDWASGWNDHNWKTMLARKRQNSITLPGIKPFEMNLPQF